METKIKEVMELLNSFRLKANPELFEKLFDDLANQYWCKFVEKNFDVVAFYAYLDDAYKPIFLDHLEKRLLEVKKE
jgi:hypothetical protein